MQPAQFGPPPYAPQPAPYGQPPSQPPAATPQYDQGLRPVQFGSPPGQAPTPNQTWRPQPPAQLAPHPQAAARGYLPIFVFLAYLAFLMTGFGFGKHLGANIGDLQALPIYVFFALLLLTLQEAIAAHRSNGRFVYVFVASAFAVLYAADAVFHPFTKGSFTLNAYTYIIINVVLVAVYLWDVFNRRMQHPEGLRGSLASYSILAADFAGLAIIFFVAAILLDFIGPQSILSFLGFHVGKPYLIVDLNKALGLHWKPPLETLEGLNYVAGLIATAVTLLLFVIVGVLLPSGPQDMAAPRLTLNQTLREVWREARGQISTSLTLVLGPFVWLVPSFSIAYFSQMITDYLNRSARSKGTILDLFNPFSSTSVSSYGQGIETLLLGVFALAMVVLAVALVEHDREIVNYTLSIFNAAARVVLVIWVFFIYSLAVINAIVILLGVTKVRPFQVGAPGLISVIFALLFFWRESLRRAPRVPATPANAPATGRR
jgi:hypothetical protein